MTEANSLSPEQARRRAWMATLAKATVTELENAWNGLDLDPGYTWLRQPEFGSTMIRARAGGTGDPFNLGEATLTRCALRLADGTAGYAFVLGRSARHTKRNEEKSRRANATKVDFLAMSRGVSLTSKVAYEDKGYQK
jgi:alpha-D-ribose 1-methylphosphonate 5-triphosphate synthase subunit PhnG